MTAVYKRENERETLHLYTVTRHQEVRVKHVQSVRLTAATGAKTIQCRGE